jgi:1,2-diacylglycerol-3-alpha-glucose alpha-1,2-galactosyltransferase
MKIRVNMLSSADAVEGQGVGSAYLELINLLKEEAYHALDLTINESGYFDINHIHTIDPMNFYKIKMHKGANIMAVHFLPHTLEGSIDLPKFIFVGLKHYIIDFYKSADYLVVVNPIFIKELIQLGIPESRIKYIPNYVSKQKFYAYDEQKRNEVRAKYNIGKDDFVVIGVGQVQMRKGVIDFVEVAKQCPQVKFLWCGGFSFGAITDGYHELKGVMESHPENVEFLGIIPREDMNDIYNVSDVLFMPSYNELFPMAILEACNLNKPLLLRNLDLYEDILFDSYLKADSNEAFTKILCDLKANSEYYQQAMDYSAKISTYYSKEHVLKQWLDFYRLVYEKSYTDIKTVKVDSEDFDKILSKKKQMLVLDNKQYNNSIFIKDQPFSILHRFNKDRIISVKIVDFEEFNYLDEETALNILIKYQDKLNLSAKDMYKFSKKKDFALLEFGPVIEE